MSKVSKFVLGAKDRLDEVVPLVVTVKYPFLNKVVDCCDHPLAIMDVLELERLDCSAPILIPPSRSVIASPSLLKQLTVVLASTNDSPMCQSGYQVGSIGLRVSRVRSIELSGTSSVSEYGRKFKGIYDQLAAIGHPVDDAEGHELFLQSVHGSTSSPATAAFMAESGRSSSSNQQFPSGGGRSGRRGRPPHCQLCHRSGHYADKCPDLSTFAQHGSSRMLIWRKHFMLNMIMLLNFAYTVLVLNYSAVGFIVLSLNETINAYRSVYFIGTVVPVVFILL
ncbi:putative RNA-directed DNA polymerase, partial [Tanacetum coccineum]